MTAFRVTPAELLALSQQVQGTAGSIESELGTLRGRVLPISGSWTGQAQDRFQALYDEWSRSAQGLQEALAGRPATPTTRPSGASPGASPAADRPPARLRCPCDTS